MRRLLLTLSLYTAILAAAAYYRPELMVWFFLAIATAAFAAAALALHLVKGAQ